MDKGKQTASDRTALTSRERDGLRVLVAGSGVKGIRDELVIAEATARTHIKNIHEKTGTHSLDQLVAWAHEHPRAWR